MLEHSIVNDQPSAPDAHTVVSRRFEFVEIGPDGAVPIPHAQTSTIDPFETRPLASPDSSPTRPGPGVTGP
jgi:hypothetical protein